MQFLQGSLALHNISYRFWFDINIGKNTDNITFTSRYLFEKSSFIFNMNKAIILVVLPCLIALVSCAYYQQQYQTGYYPAYYGQQRNVAPYAQYAVQSNQALRQARLFNYLLGGLYFLNLFNFTGNTIAG